MASFEDSLIGNDDFDPKVANDALIRSITKEPLPDELEPHMLNTRLARKLWEEPTNCRIDYKKGRAQNPRSEDEFVIRRNASAGTRAGSG